MRATKSLVVLLSATAFFLGTGGQASAKTVAEVTQEVSESLSVAFEPAFGGHEFVRPIFLTHANDGSGQLYVMGQLGTIEVLDGPDDDSPEMVLDIRDRVLFNENENEQGLLGIAFAPNFSESGELYAYYSAKQDEQNPKRRIVISRFHMIDGRLNPSSEEVLLTIDQPYWNHNGGTIVFGPDGMLYAAVGDGGKYDDPHSHGQNLNTLLASVLRIDVSGTSVAANGEQVPYKIPTDNPFANEPDKRSEIWAYGLRNVWRMAFDTKTGELWAADVGQNLWEEIDLLEAGKNYGWNVREGKHALVPRATGKPVANPDQKTFVEPIWEYDHSEGKSITGGHVYRGEAIRQLDGMYLYADYITGAVYALDYDRSAKEVRKNHVLRQSGMPVTSFGAGADGASYLMETDGTITRIVSK